MEAQRRNCLRRLEHYQTSVDDHENTPLTLQTVKRYLEKCEKILEESNSLTNKLLQTCKDEAAEIVQFEAQKDVDEAYFKIMSDLEAIQRELELALPPKPLNPFPTVKLPPINLPTFNGDQSAWSSFKDLFNAAIDTQTQLQPAQKLQYLKTALTGKPAQLIRELQITDINYCDAWNILNKRYDNTWDLAYSVLVKLLNLRTLKGENVDTLSNLMDGANECLRTLKTLGLPVDQWDMIVIVLLSEKMDPETKKEWSKTQTGVSLPTFNTFQDFMDKHIRGLKAAHTTTSKPANVRMLNHNNNKPQNVHVHHVGETTCRVCQQSHPHYKCPILIAKTPRERKELVRNLRLCYNCLNTDHMLKNCNSQRNCRVCQGRHHSMLHEDHVPPQTSTRPNVQPTNPSVTTLFATINTQVLLSTAVVEIPNRWGVDQRCRILLDGCSQGTFITESCVRRLGLPRAYSSFYVNGIGNQPVPVKGKVTTTLKSCTSADHYEVDVFILSKITGCLPTIQCATTWPHLEGLQLADPEFYQPGPIDILLGAEYYGLILKDGLIQGGLNSPTAQKTIFGWVLSGRVPTSTAPPERTVTLPTLMLQPSNITTLQAFHVEMNADILKKFWEVEEPPAAKIITKEEKICEEHFKTTYQRDDTGRYFASVPFKDTKVKMGTSRDSALRRLLQVERRLDRNPELKMQYQKFLIEYEELGHMERITTKPDNITTLECSPVEVPGSTYYFPHHGVVNESSTTTKLRVVFDGSAKTSTGLSFNDVVHVGATLQRDLFEHLLRFRFVPVALKADITKMFRQFYLAEADRDMHRILWRDPSSKEIVDYRLKTVTYGTACAPNLSTRCLQQLGMDVKEQYPDASEAILNNMYVDDYLGGANSEDEAITLYQNLLKAAATGQLEFRKWATSSPKVLEVIPEELRDMSPADFDTSTTVKTLGVQWCPATDTFTFKHNITLKRDNIARTKRVMLSELAQTFDPLGLISPVVLRGKMMMQELWKLSLDWNDTVPTEIDEWWTEFQEDLKDIVNYTIPRLAATNLSDRSELHGFSDASEKGYGVVLYVREPNIDIQQRAVVTMLTSKTKVAPLKQISLPRLELMAAVMLSKLVTYVKDVLNLNIATYLWTDSTITLRWIAASPRRWKTFVANRVAIIQSTSTVTEAWRHVPGIENPADLASRGCSVKTLLNSTLWSSGPTWLHETSLPMLSLLASTLNVKTCKPLPFDVDLEERPTPLLSFPCRIEEDDIFQRFSTLTKIKRVVAYIMRFKTKLRGPLEPDELRESLHVLVKVVQNQHFNVEMRDIRKCGHVAKSSKLKSLYPYIDANGLLRVSGRLQGANVLDNQKHQMILPANSVLTEMLVTYYHRANLHSGFQLTWSTLQSEFWILGGRDKVRHQIRRCVTCRRYRQDAAQQLMGNLPPERVTKARPFLHTGVDFAGPFTLKNAVGRVPKTYKGYICVFVCFTTKAVHLEAVSSLSADAFIATFRRFVARRGLCTNLYSDHGTNFVGANRTLQHLNATTLEGLSSQGVTFNHIPPSAPHFGGLWEAAVKSTKFHLKRAFGEAAFTFEQFATALCQVEAVLNSRPLSPMSPMPDDLQPLTPGHFLIGEPLNSVPDRCELEVPNNLLNSFRRVQQRVQNFWKQWQRDYLNTLQQRNKWYWEQPNLTVGDLILMKEDTSPGTWKMGRVIETKRDGDGKVRVVRLKTATGELNRPIVKCIPLVSKNEGSN